MNRGLVSAADVQTVLSATNFVDFDDQMEGNGVNIHAQAHLYIGGTMADPHTSFRDPVAFLLHSNIDRLFAMWQRDPNHLERLDPAQLYKGNNNNGYENTRGGDRTTVDPPQAPTPCDDDVRACETPWWGILSPVEPWAGPGDAAQTAATGIIKNVGSVRPWAPPENQQVFKDCRDPSVVAPPSYDIVTPGGLVVGLSDGTKFNTNQWATWDTYQAMKVLAGDFDGDGRIDVMKFDVPAQGTSQLGLWVGLSDGTKFNTSQWATWDTYQAMKVLAGDFDGDGRIDVMKFDVSAQGTSQLGLWVGLSDGTKFNTSQWATWDTYQAMKVLAGDFDGDGRIDVMKFDVPAQGTSQLGLWVGLSDGTKFNTSQWATWDTYRAMKVLAGDFDRDGRTDVMKFEVSS